MSKQIKLSILGDSISTFANISNNSNKYNSTIGNNRVYYGGKEYLGTYCVLDENQTWWNIVLNNSSLTLCVNNSWSGSLVLDSNPLACGYLSRSNNLHNDYTNEIPDVIIVYLGTNDANHLEVNIGEYNQVEIDEFVKSKKQPKTFTEAYALMLYNLKYNYPNSVIYGFTLLPFAYVNKERENKIYEIMCKLLNHFNINIVDLHKDCNIKLNDTYFAEKGYIHPNEKGMNAIAQTFLNVFNNR